MFQISTRLSKLLKFTSIYQVCNCVNFDSISNWKQWDPGGNCGYYNWHNQLFNAIRILYYTRSCGTLRVLLSCRVFVDRQLCCSTQPRLGPQTISGERSISKYRYISGRFLLKKRLVLIPRLFKIVFKIILLSLLFYLPLTAPFLLPFVTGISCLFLETGKLRG